MRIIDRYLVASYIRVFLICFVSLTGLYIVIDVFANIEEFIGYGKQQGGLAAVLVDYYGARVFSFFDRISGVLMLISAVFAITFVKQQNEMTALMAAGVSKARIATPVIVAVAVTSLLAVGNREFVLPGARDKLQRNAQNWRGEKAGRVHPAYDGRTEIYIGGRSAFAAEQRIEQAAFRFPACFGDFGCQLSADRARCLPATGDHPAGFLLEGIREVDEPAQCKTFLWGDEPIVLSPADYPWLERDQCFVVTDVTFETLEGGTSWQQHASTFELIRGLRNSSLGLGDNVRVTVHARLIQPFLDMTLLMIGLPLVLAGTTRSVFVAGGKCVLAAGLFFVVTLACHSLGNDPRVSPALAAWCPLLIFAPIAAGMSQPFRE